MEWVKKYMKVDFSQVIFTDECRATLDGPDGWAQGWVSSDHTPPIRMARQQGGGGVMFWAAIIDDKLIGPFRVEDGVKINANTYSAFLDKHLRPWWKKQPLRLRKSLIFMHDNAPAHAVRYTTDYLRKIGIKEDNLMIWPPCSPDLNPIENLWSMLKKEVYVAGKQYSSTDELWNAITMAANNVSKDAIKNLTSSVDNRLLTVIQRDGGCINH